MSKEDFDIFPHLAKPAKTTTAVDFVRGLQCRQMGAAKSGQTAMENLELYAEERLVHKEELNEMRCEMPGLPRSTFLMVFSPDGRRVASTHGNHNIYVTDLRSGKNIKTLIGHPRTPWCIAFHPTSDQIVASGCLGGQVRIWDLSGGSEVWTTSTQSVIASIAFHPNDRILVIATINEVYFWDWSKPEPFVQTATNNPKEKVRYVAFDKLGHKLITGIANSPQTRWERVRAPVLVPRQERCASPYRRTITQRLVLSPGNNSNQGGSSGNNPPTPPPERDTSSVPERERRITMCYRNLVREYERLVHRYLQLCRPPIMIDRGTDPMEPSHFNSGTQTAPNSDLSQPGPSGLQNSSQPGPSSSSSTPSANQEPQPSTSHSQNLITPSRIFSVPQRPPSTIRGTQTSSESRKHKSDSSAANNNEKRFKKNDSSVLSSDASSSSRESSPQVPAWSESNNGQVEASSSNTDDQRVLVVNLERLSPESLPTNLPEEANNDRSILDRPLNDALPGLPTDDFNMYPTYPSMSPSESSSVRQLPGIQYDNVRPPGHPSTSGSPGNRYSQRFDEYIRANRERIMEFRRRHHAVLSTEGSSDLTTSQENTDVDVPTSSQQSPLRNENSTQSAPGEQRNIEELLTNIRRTAEEEVRNRILPIIRSVPPPDRPELIRLFENSRVHVRMRVRQMCPVFLRRHCRRTLRIDSSTDSSSSDNDGTRQSPTRLSRRNSDHLGNQQGAGDFLVADSPASPPFSPPSTAVPSTLPTSSSTLAERNYRAELDQLVASLLSEIEWNEETPRSGSTPSPSFSTSATSARTRPTRNPMYPWSASPRTPPPGESIENLLLGSSGSRDSSRESSSNVPRRGTQSTPRTTPWNLYMPPYYYAASLYSGESSPNAFPITDTRTTNSTIYTSSNSSSPNRRRAFSHRVSAFMPTRVNYTRTRFRRTPHWTTGRTCNFNRGHRNTGIVLDELINYAEREPNEDDSSHERSAYSSSGTPILSYPGSTQENSAIVNTYSSIMHNLEASLNDVRNLIPTNTREQTSDVLNSFSSRMGLIMMHSDTILSNLRNTIEVLPSTLINNGNRADGGDTEPRWNFNDPSFYVRDLRTEASGEVEGSPTRDQDLLNSLNAATADHTYPRNPNDTGSNESLSPLMSSLHLTVSHIQRQARHLRRQVENIDRVDRAVVEMSQLQLMRRLVVQMVRHARNLLAEGRAPRVSSVRQMMAGTRISDSSPYESPNEEPGPSGLQRRTEPPQPSTSTAPNPDQPGPSTSNSSHSRRNTSRKTYPPSRLHRPPRQRRPTTLVHWFAKRCLNRLERGLRPSQPPRTTATRPTLSTSTASFDSQVFNRNEGNETALSAMARKLERILTEQMRIYTRSQNMPTTVPPAPQYSASVDLGEHILALRLHGCVLRISRLVGTRIDSTSIQNLRTSNQFGSEVASQAGSPRHVARHALSMIIDNMSRYIEELGVNTRNNGPISSETSSQMHGVFAMSILLAELLVLQVVDSIPSQAELNLESQRELMAHRIDVLCAQMLQSRVNSAPFTRSLRLMRLTMRHAHRALDQTYEARRNAMLPRQDTDRRELLEMINRCLRTINRSETAPEFNEFTSTTSPEPDVPRPSNSTGSETTYSDSFYSTIADLLPRLSDNPSEEIEASNQPSTSQNVNRTPPPMSRRDAVSSNNDNSDDDQDDVQEPDWFSQRNPTGSSGSNNTGNTVRTDANPPRTTESSSSASPRPVNVPSVHVNDVPVSEPSAFTQRLMVQRQRFAERVSELRSNPRVGLFRPRFLHPLYASVNPFDADLDDPQREQIYDSDMVTTVTPNHRIQAWDISNWTVPAISNSMKNVVVSECKIHNDASVDIANDGTILVTLLPSGGYLNVTNRLGVYSLRWETLGQCLYTTSFEQNAVSVSLSPLSRHLVVGFVSRRVSIIPSDRWVMARIYKIEQKDVPGDRLPILRELEREHRENRINCIRWLPTSGQGLIYATNTGQLVVLS